MMKSTWKYTPRRDSTDSARACGTCVGLLIGYFLITALSAWLFQLAWAFVVPKIAPNTVPTIDFWVAFVIVFILGIFFGGGRVRHSNSN